MPEGRGGWGPQQATNACIRTTDDTASELGNLLSHGAPLMKTRKFAAICCLILANLGLWASQNPKPCTRREAIRADKEASSLRSWTELYSSYKSFAQCDDGGIGEGYSDSVARLLSDHWNSTNQLNRLVSRDKDFERFVLRHIDELMSPAQAKNIRDNAEARCPSNAKRLCKRITARIRETGP